MAVINGDNNSNILTSPAGNDIISAYDGYDFIYVYANSGVDAIDGGQGFDWLVASNNSGLSVFASLADGTYALVGAGGGASGTLVGIEALAGGDNADILVGNALDNILDGGGGDDVLQGGLGADELRGYGGSDTASYAQAIGAVSVFLAAPGLNGGEAAGDTFIAIENLNGSAWNDLLSGDTGSNKLSGQGGHDFLAGGGGDDTLDGFTGNDVLASGSGRDTMLGGDGSDWTSYELAQGAVRVDLMSPAANTGEAVGDTYSSVENIRGSAFHDILQGNDIANTINGDAGDDQVFGRGGDDVIWGSAGADVMSGGAGTDAADYGIAGGGAVKASLLNPASNTGLAAGDSYVSIEALLGTSLADQLAGDNLMNRLDGRSGADKLYGNGGSDTLVGGAGPDMLDGGAGVDTADYAAASQALIVDLGAPGTNSGDAAGDTYVSVENVVGSAFADTLRGNTLANALNGGAGDDALQGGLGGDLLDGGIGTDTASYGGAAAGVTADLRDAASANSGEAAGDSYVSIENMLGSAFDDTLGGDDRANRLDGGTAGKDRLFGRDGEDVLVGGAGDDTLEGGEGGDGLLGGIGSDTASYAGASEPVEVSLASPGTNTGEARYDVFSSIENLVGSIFDDILRGDGLGNRLEGGPGSDALLGLGGNDTLFGGAGADHIDGGAGVDAATGGPGDDIFEVDGASDIVVEGANEGIDRVHSYVSWTLSANVENLVLYGTANLQGTGNTLANVINGNLGNNVLQGLGGADRLLGYDGHDTLDGGTGNDTLEGGIGNDTYIVDAAADTIVEAAGAGTETVQASASFSLAPNVENLTLTGTANTAGTGNSEVNRLVGNAGNNHPAAATLGRLEI